MKKRIFIGTVAALLVLSIPALAQRGPMQGRGFGFQLMMQELKLTDQQQKDVDKIHSDTQKEQIDRQAQIAKARVELSDLLKSDNPNQPAIEKKLNDIGTLENQGKIKHLNVWFAINKVLTPEQQKIWQKTLERHASMGMGMGRGMNRTDMKPRTGRMMQRQQRTDRPGQGNGAGMMR